MTTFKRLVVQVHDIQADSPEQADTLARIIAEAVNVSLRPLGHATAWAATVVPLDSEEGGLGDIIDHAYLLDEVDGVTAYVPLGESTVFDLLLAWRDAAVKAAAQAMLDALTADLDQRIKEITGFLDMVSVNYFNYDRLLDERAELMRVKRDREAAVKRALES